MIELLPERLIFLPERTPDVQIESPSSATVTQQFSGKKGEILIVTTALGAQTQATLQHTGSGNTVRFGISNSILAFVLGFDINQVAAQSRSGAWWLSIWRLSDTIYEYNTPYTSKDKWCPHG